MALVGSAMIAGVITYITFLSVFLGIVLGVVLITSILMANEQ